MRRREFIAGLAFVPAAGRAWAQERAKMFQIAIFTPSYRVADVSETGESPFFAALFEELRRLGYREGQNLGVERLTEDRTEHFDELVLEVVRRKPDLILTLASATKFKNATTTIPVIVLTNDPLTSGLVTSLARPGGNITGVSVDAGVEIWGKRLEILKEAVPTASRVAFLAPRAYWESSLAREIRDAARRFDLSLLGPPLDGAIDEAEYRRVVAAMNKLLADAALVPETTDNFRFRRLIVELFDKAGLPALYPYREGVELGGLIAHTYDRADLGRRMAGQIDQILRDARPGDIPIVQPTKFDLVINLKTAKALGLTISPSVLARADEVIE